MTPRIFKRTFVFDITWAGSDLWGTAQSLRTDEALGYSGHILRVVTRLTTDGAAAATGGEVLLVCGPYVAAPANFDDVPDEHKALEITGITLIDSDTDASDDTNLAAAPAPYSAVWSEAELLALTGDGGPGLWLNVKLTSASGNGDNKVLVTLYYERVS